MAFDLNKILRPHIAQLKPYSSARDEYSGKEGVFLDANENPFGSITSDDFNRYPDPYQFALKTKISAIKNVPVEQIFLGNGSDEAIDLLMRAFCRPGLDNIIILPPTYGMYEVSAEVNDIAIKKVNLTADFQLRPAAILDAVDENTKIIFICSPNNPSGNKVDREDILKVIKDFDGLVVVDEAYIDFSDEPSFTTELKSHPNLLVMQTFSKAWGLASLRLGMAFASLEIIKIINKIKPPYNISGLTQETVLAAIDDTDRMKRMVAEIMEERDFLQQAFEKMDLIKKIYPSHANFLLVEVPAAKKTYDYLIDNQIIVRDRSKVVLCHECLRISVGTRAENERLLEALQQCPAELATA
ncbi:histidinol-phosphate transaminase [Echinicola salinicaeni]|uniref:histidinol-phosphate transaminase n=1 Tax=Echinicola salinicaeni TaxID=2762757 RepID=UPI0016461818|nr:histidinol-phosphate transaminase [Echinicola salinicaeni]